MERIELVKALIKLILVVAGGTLLILLFFIAIIAPFYIAIKIYNLVYWKTWKSPSLECIQTLIETLNTEGVDDELQQRLNSINFRVKHIETIQTCKEAKLILKDVEERMDKWK